jgi:hypothetical protein
MNIRRAAWIWQDYTTATLPALVDLARALSLTAVFLKAGDSGAVWPQWKAANIAPFVNAGIEVLPWFWLNYDSAEVSIVRDAYQRVPFDAYILDVEIPDENVNTHWSDATDGDARTFIADVRSAFDTVCPGDNACGFSSCGSWDGSRGNWFPYAGVAQACDFSLPQWYKDFPDELAYEKQRGNGLPCYPVLDINDPDSYRKAQAAASWGGAGISLWRLDYAGDMGNFERALKLFPDSAAEDVAIVDESAQLKADVSALSISAGSLLREGVVDVSRYGGGKAERIAAYEKGVYHRLNGHTVAIVRQTSGVDVPAWDQTYEALYYTGKVTWY